MSKNVLIVVILGLLAAGLYAVKNYGAKTEQAPVEHVAPEAHAVPDNKDVAEHMTHENAPAAEMHATEAEHTAPVAPHDAAEAPHAAAPAAEESHTHTEAPATAAPGAEHATAPAATEQH